MRHQPRRLVRRLWPIVVLALLGSLALAATSNAASPHTLRPLNSNVRFEGGGGVDSESREAAEMHDIQHFDEHAQEHPVTSDQFLFSRCRFEPFAGDVNVYAPLASWERDVIVDDTPFQFADGTSCYNPQNEQNIVVNPTNRNNIVTSANDYRYEFRCFAYVSMDGGDTWANVAMPGWSGPTGAKGQFIKTGCGGDPVMAFGPDGSLYFAAITYNLDKFPRTMSGVAVGKSTDGGLTWSPPVMVRYNATGDFFIDKEWLAVGPDGTVYLSWTKYYQGPRGLGYSKSPIFLSTSTNGGKSWSSEKAVSDPSHPYDQGSQIGFQSDGSVIIAYEGASPTTGYTTDALVVARSTDNGRTFTNTEVARVFDDLDCYPIQEPGGQDRQTLTNAQIRMNSFPSMAVDPTNDRIAIVWTDNEGAGTCGQGGDHFEGVTSNQVKLVTSWDGVTWDPVRTITDSAPDKVFPAVGANAGLIAVGYFTREFATEIGPNRECGIMERDVDTGDLVPPQDPDRANAVVCFDWAMKSSADDFGATVRVSSQSSNPYTLFAGSFIGDYEGTAVDDQGRVYTVWTDSRGNPGVTPPNQDTYVGMFDMADLPQ
jgi:hypothetical protein